jgi:hypothetical protein
VRVETSDEQLRRLALSAGAITELEVRTLEGEILQLVNVVRDIANAEAQPSELRGVKV